MQYVEARECTTRGVKGGWWWRGDAPAVQRVPKSQLLPPGAIQGDLFEHFKVIYVFL